MKKVLSIVLMICLLLSLCANFVGCNPGDEDIDPDKTQIYVGVFNSGVGRLWIDELDRIYEERNPNIQIIVDYKGDELASGELKRTMSEVRQDVFFLNSMIMNDIIYNPEVGTLVENLADIMMEGEENSIYSKMWDETKSSMINYGTEAAPEYYTLPYFVSHYGMVYDVDMFDAYELFDLAGYKGLDCIDGNANDTYGPDGVENTYDDGLPATWEDFKILLDVMVDKGIVPFTYSAKEPGYQNRWLSSIWASYEGANDYSLLTSLSGTDSQFGTITPENAWQLSKQTGKYAALKVAEYLVRNSVNANGNSKYISSRVLKGGSHSAINAQVEFINSWPASLPENGEQMKPVAFLLEGDWWENEAKDSGTFDDCVEEYGDDKWGYGERNFAYFPFPKFKGSYETDGIPDQTNEMTTLGANVGNNTAGAFINKYSDVKDEAKKFLKFCYSDEANAIFTQITGLMKPFDYDMTNVQLDALTPYQRSLWDMVHDANSKIDRVSGIARSNIYYYESAYVKDAFNFAARVPGVGGDSGAKLMYPLDAFITYKDSALTADKYFNNLVAGTAKAGEDVINATTWFENLGEYFN